MSSKRHPISRRILILFLILGILPLGIGALILLNGARISHQEETGNLLSSLADGSQTSVKYYLQHRIVQVATVGTVPAVRGVVLAANPRQVTALEEELEGDDWGRLDANVSPLLKAILGNPASRFLRAYKQVAPAFREISVTDVHGRVVAATNKTSDYFQADERWWQYAYRQGAGGHYLGDVNFDESASAYVVEIAEPVIDPANNTAIGVVKAVFGVQEIVALINSIGLGGHGQAVLFRGDGSVVISQGSGLVTAETYPFADQVANAVSGGRSWLDAGSGHQRLAIGLPRSRLKESYPELDWYLVVESQHSAAAGALSNLNVHFLYVVLFSVVVVLILTFLFSRNLSKPIIETDPHLDSL
jgi:hypothetical protein